MDWGRAKSILIFTFLLLNVLLGFQLWHSKINLANHYFNNRSMTQQTEQLLRSKNILLMHDIPKETPSLSEIAVKTASLYVPENTMFTLPEPVPVQEVLYKNSIREPLSTYIPLTEQYQYDPVESESGVYKYNQLYNGIPMFGLGLTFYSEQGKVTSYQQHNVEVYAQEESEKQRVLSAYMAVRHLAENVLTPDAVIEDIRLGYHGTVYDTDSILLFPKWRIAIKDGSIYYIHAINGALEEVKRPEE